MSASSSRLTSFALLALLTLALPAALACGSTTNDVEEPEPMVAGDGDGDQIAGQSGNEGSALRPPCFYQDQIIVTVEVQSEPGACFVGEVVELISDGAKNSDVSVGDAIGGMVSLFYTSSPPSVGDTVTAQYMRGSQDGITCPEYVGCSAEECSSFNHETQAEEFDACDTACLEDTREACAAHADDTALGGNVQVSSMAGDLVEIEWLGGTYEFSHSELLADTCGSSFAELPNLIDESDSDVDPDDAARPAPPPEDPISCP
jgi:hypothetical protein